MRSGRGVRQGCPLSPYLVLICAEGFSALIRQHERLRLLEGFACARGAPRVSHLLFADDSVIFCRASLDNCGAIKHVLSAYEEASGQAVNLDKSSNCFSPNLDVDLIENVKGVLCPSFIGRYKRKAFQTIKERVGKKLQLWKTRFFSSAGREVLIKAVVQAIPTYTMSVFRLPSSLIHHL